MENPISSHNRFYRKLPNEIRDILSISHGWLVGSSIKSLLEDSPVNDYDIIIVPEYYNASYSYLRQHNIGFNSFGGLAVTIGDIKIDMWIQDLSSFIMAADNFSYAYNFSKNRLIKIQ